MKCGKRMIAAAMAVLLGVHAIPVSVHAAEENTPKEEVVYINLNGDGSVKEINVVNIFDLTADDTIIDYGDYEGLRNMTTTDDIQYQDGRISIEAKSGKLYYEGKLSGTSMPWNIAIHYYLDGKEYQAKELAGKNGSLKITMKITQNEECDSNFFEGYALQASFILNTNQCSNLKAEGATIANVGSDKQLTYTILPGKGAEIEVTGDVKNFEMSAIAINGVRLNMDIDVDDTEIQEKIGKITDAVGDLDQGAGKLTDGSSQLFDATGTLKAKVGELDSGVGKLKDGAGQLAGGLSQITGKSEELKNGAWSAYEGLCAAAGKVVNAQLAENGLSPVSLTPENYSQVLRNLLAQMDADAVYEQAYQTALSQVTAQAEEQADALYEGYIESQADSFYLAYLQSQADTLYTQAASQAVFEQLIQNGLTEEEAAACLRSEAGQQMVQQAKSGLTEEQKTQIISTAAQNLTEDQKSQILQGALASLTEEQKSQIRNGYIQQMMAIEEVTSQITAAVSGVSEAAAAISELKGQLDSFGVFCQGVNDYTAAVGSAASGANTLNSGLNQLYQNTGVLESSVGKLHSAVEELFRGTKELKDGTGEFAEETSDIDTQVSDQIDEMISSISGEAAKTVSFVSEKNTNIESVQFVIQTESIEAEETAEEVVKEEAEPVGFWEKLLALFGIFS